MNVDEAYDGSGEMLTRHVHRDPRYVHRNRNTEAETETDSCQC